MHETEPASGGRAFVGRLGNAQIAGSVVEISVLHKGRARAFAALRVAADQRGQKFCANQTSRFLIVRSDQTLVVWISTKNFLCLVSDAVDAFTSSIIRCRCHG